MNRPAAWTAAVLAAASGACASVQAQREREEYLQSRLDSFRFSKPLDEVWPQVQRLLADKNYPLVGKDGDAVGDPHGTLYSLFSPAKETSREADGSRWLETGWRKDQTRYRVEGTPEGSGCRVVFTLLHEDTTEHGHDARERKRGLEMELELARRIDPEAAAGIEAGLPAMKRG